MRAGVRTTFIFLAGETPLIHSSRQGHYLTAKYLLEHGADPSASSDLGATALHHAAGIGLLFFCVSTFLLIIIRDLLALNMNISVNKETLLLHHTMISILMLSKNGMLESCDLISLITFARILAS